MFDNPGSAVIAECSNNKSFVTVYGHNTSDAPRVCPLPDVISLAGRLTAIYNSCIIDNDCNKWLRSCYLIPP